MTSEMIWPENSLTSRETATPFIRVLGPLQLQAGQIDCTPTAPKVRQVLALLVLRSNQLVSTEALMEDLWEGCPPRSSLTTLQTYIYHLRKMIEREGIASDGEEVVETRPPGYSLRIAEDSTDLQIFQRLTKEGRTQFDDGAYDQAAKTLRAALSIWVGCPLNNVNQGPRLRAYVLNLKEQYMAVLRLALQAEMELGMYRELVPELRLLVSDHPLDEWMHGLLIQALKSSGRRGDALRVFHQLRIRLDEELGLSPSAELHQLHADLLKISYPEQTVAL